MIQLTTAETFINATKMKMTRKVFLLLMKSLMLKREKTRNDRVVRIVLSQRLAETRTKKGETRRSQMMRKHQKLEKVNSNEVAK